MVYYTLQSSPEDVLINIVSKLDPIDLLSYMIADPKIKKYVKYNTNTLNINNSRVEKMLTGKNNKYGVYDYYPLFLHTDYKDICSLFKCRVEIEAYNNNIIFDTIKNHLLDFYHIRYNLTVEKHCDFTEFKNLYILDLSHNGCLTSLDLPINCKDLNLSFNRSLDNLSMINNINKLERINLTQCKNIIDVGILGKIMEVNLSNCYNITDVSLLGNVKNLNLSNCYNITDVSMLGAVEMLNLSYCYKITDVSMLGNTRYLNIAGCRGIRKISALYTVHILIDTNGCKIVS